MSIPDKKEQKESVEKEPLTDLAEKKPDQVVLAKHEKPATSPKTEAPAGLAQDATELKIAASPKSVPIKTVPVSPAEEKKIAEAVELAFAEGIQKAVDFVRQSGQAHLVDALHDKIIDELAQRLKQAGKLEEV